MPPANQHQLQISSETPLRYHFRPGSRADEVFTAEGEQRAHWRYLLDSLETLGRTALQDREAKALRILRDDGATYNIYDSDHRAHQTWGLDLVPALISSEEWAFIEAGLLERAELFNFLLKDIYGPRDLIRTGVIPPEALFGHRGFLRACDGLELPGEHNLILHGVDLVRDARGSFCVMTDRCQSPSGAGYALENRTVMSRVLPSLFRDSHVHRLATFFQRLRNKLTSLASKKLDQPRVVVLTPGAHNETYFEHAYIASYLGFDLVQSGDLVVRDGCVWMKSLDGLSRVDVILRRVDDWFCDPVELRSDSQLGVANLLEVVRARRVVIANPLGSGVLENPIFNKYLPGIAKTLLGRQPRLPTVTTYWGGDAKDKAFILANFDQLVVKPTFRGSGLRSVLPQQLSKAERANLLAQLEARPSDFVAQPIVAASQIPSFVEGKLEPRPSILRTFAVASDTSYALMPGGLTRVGASADVHIITNQTGSFSKDTWVIASEPEREQRADDTLDPNLMTRDSGMISLPSRVVENMFWMGRYAERAESTLRILRTVFMLLNGEEAISDICRENLLRTVTKVSSTQPGFLNAGPALLREPESELLLLVRDPNRMGSVRSNLNAMLLCSDESKEMLSSDTLRVINDIRDALGELDDTLSGGLASAPEEALDPLVTALMALSGLAHESMLRSVGWRFLDMGRRLERGLQTTMIIKGLLSPEVTPHDQNTLIEAMLLTMETLISYRRRYRARMGVQTSLDLVLMDTSNPRSLLYQIEQISQHLDGLPKVNDTRHELSGEQRALLEAETMIKLSLLTELSTRENGQRKTLSDNLDRINTLLGTVSDLLSDKYFDHRETSHQLVRSLWEAGE